MIWRGVEGEDEEKRLWLMKEILKKTLRREVGIKEVEKRRGKEEDRFLIMKMEKMKDKEKVLEKGAEIGRLWRV